MTADSVLAEVYSTTDPDGGNRLSDSYGIGMLTVKLPQLHDLPAKCGLSDRRAGRCVPNAPFPLKS